MKTEELASHLILKYGNDTPLHELPKTEFLAGGLVSDLLKTAGYYRSSKMIIKNLNWWSKTTSEFIDEVKARTLKNYSISIHFPLYNTKAKHLRDALADCPHIPRSVTDAASFEKWLERIGAYGAIYENGVGVARFS
jgi:hypothetical protein